MKRKKQIDARSFIETWQMSTSAIEAAKRLNMTTNAATVRASMFRKRGIPLKKFGGPGVRLDIATLTKLAKSVVEKTHKANATKKNTTSQQI